MARQVGNYFLTFYGIAYPVQVNMTNWSFPQKRALRRQDGNSAPGEQWTRANSLSKAHFPSLGSEIKQDQMSSRLPFSVTVLPLLYVGGILNLAKESDFITLSGNILFPNSQMYTSLSNVM